MINTVFSNDTFFLGRLNQALDIKIPIAWQIQMLITFLKKFGEFNSNTSFFVYFVLTVFCIIYLMEN